MNDTNKSVKEWEERIGQKIVETLANHMSFNSKDGTDWHILTRIKEARSYGTLTIDDFSEVNNDNLNELADALIPVIKSTSIDKEVLREKIEALKLYSKEEHGGADAFCNKCLFGNDRRQCACMHNDALDFVIKSLNL